MKIRIALHEPKKNCKLHISFPSGISHIIYYQNIFFGDRRVIKKTPKRTWMITSMVKDNKWIKDQERIINLHAVYTTAFYTH